MGALMNGPSPHRPLLCCLVLFAAVGLSRAESPGGPEVFARLKFRSLGPAAGGRVCRAAGVPGDPRTFYAATAGGGVWKSSDGGLDWEPVFDDQPDSSIGALAIAPSAPSVVYVGAGEANIRGNVQVGNGIYKSSDAGKTWQHVWKQEGQIGTLVVHPRDDDIAYAAVLGHAFGPNPERGVYRTRDGGKSWQRVLFKDADTGASDVCIDPSQPQVLFAGLWQARRRPWELVSGGPGSGLYISRDGGDSWTQLVAPPSENFDPVDQKAPKGQKYCPGLPDGVWGKVGVAVAPSDSRRVYALIEAEEGGLFRSDDGGDTWKRVSSVHAIRQRAFYYTTLTVDPNNPNVVWCPQVPLLRSIDGGRTFRRIEGVHHGDHHDIWIDPTDSRRIIDSNDGGVDVSTNGGRTWHAAPLPIAQFYHISADNRLPYHVAGTMQDIGTASGPSDALNEHGIPPSDWHPVGGGETGFTVSDPTDPNIVYAGEYGGFISRYDHRTRQTRNIGVYPFNPSGHGAEDLRYRFQWVAPILLSPHDPHVLYHAANVLFRTADAGLHWSPVSPDLTRNDRGKQKWSGGPITGDNTGVEVYGTIFAIAESPLEKGLLWAGSDDGLVHVLRNGDKNWSNVTTALGGLPEWATVTCIEPSPFDAETAYVVADAHKLDDRRPYLYRTRDLGKTWQSLTDGLPADTGHLNVVRADPRRKGLLYLGGEHGLYASWDDGRTWEPLRLNLPTVSVTDLIVKHNDLIVATNGRSLWVFDDLTPLRQWRSDRGHEGVTLLPPAPAIRYRAHREHNEVPPQGSAKNPPRGAILHYFLPHRPDGEITLTILDSAGKTVRTLSSKRRPKEENDEELGAYEKKEYKPTILPRGAGLQRVVWDLRHQGADIIFGARIDAGEPRVGPLVRPGIYTLRLTVEGKTTTAQVEVLHDPRLVPAAAWERASRHEEGARPLPPEEVLRRVDVRGLDDDLEQQLEMALKIREDISRLTQTVEQIRLVREQLATYGKLLADQPKAEPLVHSADEVRHQLDVLEERLHNPHAKITYDILAQRGGAKLYSQLAWLFEMVKASDGVPTQGVREVFEEQHSVLEECRASWRRLRGGDLERLEQLARKLDVPGVILPVEGKGK
jgi:photosystem II stability/assembly factor-like uncharacterized protein